MKKYIEKAAVLVEALPYIQSFRSKTVVIKFGGSVMSDRASLESILRDVVFMECVGINPVVIHGGGPKITDRMNQMGLDPRFVEGLRVTDEKTIKIVEDTLMEVNQELVDVIKKFGGRAKGLSGQKESMILVSKHPFVEVEGANGEVENVDIGYVGDVKVINVEPIRKIVQKQAVPVIAPIGVDLEGHAYNINGDYVAAQIAVSLKAEKLVYLSDVHGVLKDPDDRTSLAPSLNPVEVQNMLNDKRIRGGMVPKIKSGLSAVNAGVHKTHIIDGHVLHSLLLEIFTDKGVGTEIVGN